MLDVVGRILQGAIDVHCHGYPEIALDWGAPQEDKDWIERARDCGIRAVVLKSHMWPTIGRAHVLRQMIQGIEIFGSVTLNPCVGGVNGWVVEAAAKLGARVVWMPTWGAQHDIDRTGVSRIFRRLYPSLRLENGLRIVDEDCRLRPEAKDVLEVARHYNLALFSGHLSPMETLALAREASRMGYRKLVFGHPNSPSVGATIEDMRTVVELGGWLEFCFVGALPRLHRFSPEDIMNIVNLVGPERCLLSTDVFYWWCPPEPEMFRMYLATMLDLGLSEDSLRRMVQQNPVEILGL